ncbi:class I SAM-dependent methyltransferase [Myxococcota bacterium]|nr:class I SAM-dependent methyltransferase [Myxococcota bacterium]
MELLDRAIEAVARARAPKEPPKPLGQVDEGETVLEKATCPICGGTRGRVELEGVDDWLTARADASEAPSRAQRYAVVRCEICTARYTSPRLRREHKSLAFPEDYPFYVRAHAEREGRHLDAKARAAAKSAFRGRADRLSKLHPRPGRLLDLGSGDGYFLELMRDRGWSVVGVDVADIVVWHAKERLGISTVHVLDAEVDPLPEGPFDAVTMWGVLQLAYRPQRLLEKVRDVLAPGGIAGVGVSNAKSVGAWVFGERWRGLGLPRHLVHFTPETLERLVRWTELDPVHTSFETPRWIVAGSIDNVLPKRLPTTKLVKLAAYGVGALAGRTRFGDTIELYAKRRP